ncbi:MAG: hypothetical protein JWP74_1603 [Marmoricola sp.]|nr:hypothetical protein [Marmoricola sp.]
MRTGPSWTEITEGFADLRALLAFRQQGLAPAQRKRLRIAGLVLAGLTLVVIVAPAYVRTALPARSTGHLVGVLPSFYLGFAVLAVLGAVTSGGGRELVPREQAVAFPVSAVTEHFGALLLAPLNIAWLLQAWAILGTTGWVLGPTNLAGSVLPIIVWIVIATALGQLVGWIVEGVRRGVHGILVTRMLAVGAVAGLATLVLTGRFAPLLDRSPTVRLYLAALDARVGAWGAWALAVLELLVLAGFLVAAGMLPARWALARPQREELRLEGEHHEAVPNPRSDLIAMIRIDRASIWRSVPLRRGVLVLALMPGAVALAGNLHWSLVTILPGLVASGGALLFGVNAWCLDGRGALWRESLPAAPGIAYAAKVVVLLEVLLAAGGGTILLASFRAGVPTGAELASVLAATVVVALQVTAAALRWSVRSPYAVDLRSARATPAPPVVMAGYSARLAVGTTTTGLLFSATALAPNGAIAVLVAIPFVCWSTYRLLRTGRDWADPVVRSRVVAVVAS